MSWLSNILPGAGDGDEGRRDVPRDRGLVERNLQLCRGVRLAAAAVPEAHRPTARRAMELAGRLQDALEPLEEAVQAAVPGTVASSEGVTVPGAREDRPPISAPLEVLEEAEERLDGIHYALLRLKILGEVPDDVDLSGRLAAFEEFVDGLEAQLPESPDEAVAGDRP